MISAPVVRHILILLAVLLSSVELFAVVGERLPSSDLPGSICLLERLAPSGDRVDYCSATIVSPNRVSTAAHCVRAWDAHQFRLSCPKGFRSPVDLEEVHPDADLESLSSVISQNSQNDLAILVLKQDFPFAPHQVAENLEKVQDLLGKTRGCAIFGYGGVHRKHVNYGKLQGVRVDSAVLRLTKQGGLEAQLGESDYSGLISSGDSGGSLSCKDEYGEWVHVGVASNAPLTPYQSNFAPYYASHPKLILPGGESTASAQCLYALGLKRLGLKRIEGLVARARLELLPLVQPGLARHYSQYLHSLKLARRALSAASTRDQGCAAFYKNMRELTRELDLLEDRLGELVVERLQSGAPGEYYIKPFSLIEIDRFNKESFELKRFKATELARFAKQPNPYAVVDIHSSALSNMKVSGESVQADVFLYGPSSHFLCESNILCAEGKYKNLVIPVGRLTRIKPKIPGHTF